jgi:hypothetical protein
MLFEVLETVSTVIEMVEVVDGPGEFWPVHASNIETVIVVEVMKERAFTRVLRKLNPGAIVIGEFTCKADGC